MSSEQLKKGRCHSVCVFVRSFFRSPFFLVSLDFHLVLKRLYGVLRVLEVSRVFQESFKDVSRVFQVSFKGVYKKFQGSLKGVSRKLQECFKEVSGKFQGCFKQD